MWKYITTKTMGNNIRKGDVNNDGHVGWRELDIKDRIAYIMAIILIISGIIMGFMCFFLTDDHDITNGVLMYISESFVTGGALLGIGIWVKGKMGEINNYVHQKLDRV